MMNFYIKIYEKKKLTFFVRNKDPRQNEQKCISEPNISARQKQNLQQAVALSTITIAYLDSDIMAAA